jgi:hypothetical protein
MITEWMQLLYFMISEKRKIIRCERKLEISLQIENMAVNRWPKGEGVDAAEHW